jgi:hypothetical protein
VDSGIDLDQVEDDGHLFAAAQLDQLLQEPILGLDHRAVQQDGLHDHAGHLSGVLV